jgi:hypothetical protein
MGAEVRGWVWGRKKGGPFFGGLVVILELYFPLGTISR